MSKRLSELNRVLFFVLLGEVIAGIGLIAFVHLTGWPY